MRVEPWTEMNLFKNLCGGEVFFYLIYLQCLF